MADLAHFKARVHLHVNLVIFARDMNPLVSTNGHVLAWINIHRQAQRIQIAPVRRAVYQCLVQGLAGGERLQNLPKWIDKTNCPQPRAVCAREHASCECAVVWLDEMYLVHAVRNARGCMSRNVDGE